MDEAELKSSGFTVDDRAELAATWFAGARGALWQADFLTNHSLECLQIIVLSGVYLVRFAPLPFPDLHSKTTLMFNLISQQNNQDRADAFWGISGAGIRVSASPAQLRPPVPLAHSFRPCLSDRHHDGHQQARIGGGAQARGGSQEVGGQVAERRHARGRA